MQILYNYLKFLSVSRKGKIFLFSLTIRNPKFASN